MSTLWTTPGSYAELCLNCGHCAIDHENYRGRCFGGRCRKECTAFVGRPGAQATLLPSYNANPYAEEKDARRHKRAAKRMAHADRLRNADS